jgi:hypothetical protein
MSDGVGPGPVERARSAATRGGWQQAFDLLMEADADGLLAPAELPVLGDSRGWLLATAAIAGYTPRCPVLKRCRCGLREVVCDRSTRRVACLDSGRRRRV